MINLKSRSHKILITNITNGFTIVELLVVIAIIGILSTIGVVSFSSIQSNARNTQRSSRVTILSEALEKYYDKNGEYPSCAAMTASPATVTSTTLKGLDPDVLTSPTGTKGTNSISCVDSPNPDSFAYVGGLTQYTLKYKEEDSSTVPILDSRRHVATTTYTLSLAAGTGGTVNAGGSYNTDTVQTITATPSTYYSFSSWTGSTGCSGVASHTITMDAAKSCTANFTPTTIAVPATPVVAANTVGATTTFSWGTASCSGNTARYQYRYSTSYGFVSNPEWNTTSSTSVAFTTSSEGYTYTVAVQAQCYNTATSTGWSGSGSAGYTRPITTYWGCTDPAANNYNSNANANDGSCTYPPITYTLTLNYTGSGSVSGGGTYNAGSTPTITASPSTYYSFSSWSCGGAQSQVITVNSNMSCTANFTVTPISTPSAPSVSANTAGSTTTFSWGAASCSGNTARYQYRYSISPSGFVSNPEWNSTASTSVQFTTSTVGQTYTVAAQAECYNAVTSSGMSAAGSAGYTRPIIPVGGWYSGIVATALAGKKVYETDLGATYQYKTSYDAVTSPQGATGLDPDNPSQMSLVSPQANPGVDFSAYPAQNACKSIGGRLPNTRELNAIYISSVAYGNNFKTDYSPYFSSTEDAWDTNSANAFGLTFPNGNLSAVGKTYSKNVRCVKD